VAATASFGGVELPAPDVDDVSARHVLVDGSIDVLGRMPWSSNATFLVLAECDGVRIPAVYKPRRGERPLWDFPGGTLCQREVAAFELSEALGWQVVPDTVLRDGPLGTGAVQRFVDHDPDEHYFSLLGTHADRFRAFAVFDVLANNADRKGGHCLRSRADGRVVGIDHGLTFHPVPKLRTVIWDFAGERVPDALVGAVRRVCDDLDGGELTGRLEGLLSPHEVDAIRDRARRLLAHPVLPAPDPSHHCYPWPLV
jgi:hypothetical protein